MKISWAPLPSVPGPSSHSPMVPPSQLPALTCRGEGDDERGAGVGKSETQKHPVRRKKREDGAGVGSTDIQLELDSTVSRGTPGLQPLLRGQHQRSPDRQRGSPDPIASKSDSKSRG